MNYLKEFNNAPTKFYNQTIIDTFTNCEKAILQFLVDEIGVLEGDDEDTVKKQIECIKGKSLTSIINYFKDNDYEYMGSYKFIKDEITDIIYTHSSTMDEESALLGKNDMTDFELGYHSNNEGYSIA
tara:strand:+ start:217 stop:597 length:381 start_codon:yes stop_codon:yes gene_type:complete